MSFLLADLHPLSLSFHLKLYWNHESPVFFFLLRKFSVFKKTLEIEGLIFLRKKDDVVNTVDKKVIFLAS